MGICRKDKEVKIVIIKNASSWMFYFHKVVVLGKKLIACKFLLSNGV